MTHKPQQETAMVVEQLKYKALHLYNWPRHVTDLAEEYQHFPGFKDV